MHESFGSPWNDHHKWLKRAYEEYVCKVAKTVEQAAELIEAGFDYVCEIDGIKLFRKRK